MPRFLVTTCRTPAAPPQSALEAVNSEPGVTLLNSSNPQMVTIEASESAADRLRDKLKGTHFVEPEIRREPT
jgi:hypothetical protein